MCRDPHGSTGVLTHPVRLPQTRLGQGQFSEVRYGLRKTNKQGVAIKVINKAGTSSAVRVAQEVQIMRHCAKISCPYLVVLYDVFETDSDLYVVRPSSGHSAPAHATRLAPLSPAPSARLRQPPLSASPSSARACAAPAAAPGHGALSRLPESSAVAARPAGRAGGAAAGAADRERAGRAARRGHRPP